MKRTNHKSAFGEEEELAMIRTNQRAAFGVFGCKLLLLAKCCSLIGPYAVPVITPAVNKGNCVVTFA